MRLMWFTAIILALTLYGCAQKKEDVAPDSSQVKITIQSPAEGQTFRTGDTVFLKALVNYVSEMHGYELTLRNAADSTVLYENDQHVHTDNFNIADYWIDTLSGPADIRLTLSAEIDHEGHSASKDVNFKSLP